MEGYQRDDSKPAEYTDYGEWSSWQREPVTQSETRQTDTKTVDAVYKTEYNYSRWMHRDPTWSGPAKGVWGGYFCSEYQERGWGEKLDVYSEETSMQAGHFYMYGTPGDTWYNETVKEVMVSEGSTEYRYRDRKRLNYFYKTEIKESAEEVKESDTILNVVKMVRYVEE